MAVWDEKNPVADAATQQQQQSPNNIGQILSSVLGNLNRGTIPLTTNSTTGGTFIPPVQKQVAPYTTQAPNEFRSKGAAKMAAASNLFGNVASAINTAKQNNDAQKSRKLAIDVERVYTAQAGINQARETLKQNPNDPNAKQMLEKNTQIINDMLADPKKRKELEEAFNYSFIGDDKKANSWQRKAGQMGAQTYQQQLEKQMPQTEQINPVAVQQQKAQTDQMKAMMPMISAMIRAASEQDKTQQQVQSQQGIAQAKIAQQADDSWLKFQASEDRTKAYGQAEKMRYTAMFQRNTLMAQQIQNRYTQDGINNIIKTTKDTSDFIDKNIKSLTSRVNQLTRTGNLNNQEKAELQDAQKQLENWKLKSLDSHAKLDAINAVVSGRAPVGAITNTTTGGNQNARPSPSSSTGTGVKVAPAAGPTTDDQSDDDLINETTFDDEDDKS